MSDLKDVFQSIVDDETKDQDVRDQAKKVIDDLSEIVVKLVNLGYPMDKLEIDTEELVDGGMDIFFCMDGYEIPLDMDYLGFQQYKLAMDAQTSCETPQ